MTAIALGVATLVLAMLVHTGVLFRWGGALTEIVRRNATEIDGLRRTQTEQAALLVRATTTLERVEARLDKLEREYNHE